MQILYAFRLSLYDQPGMTTIIVMNLLYTESVGLYMIYHAISSMKMRLVKSKFKKI